MSADLDDQLVAYGRWLGDRLDEHEPSVTAGDAPEPRSRTARPLVVAASVAAFVVAGLVLFGVTRDSGGSDTALTPADAIVEPSVSPGDDAVREPVGEPAEVSGTAEDPPPSIVVADSTLAAPSTTLAPAAQPLNCEGRVLGLNDDASITDVFFVDAFEFGEGGYSAIAVDETGRLLLTACDDNPSFAGVPPMALASVRAVGDEVAVLVAHRGAARPEIVDALPAPVGRNDEGPIVATVHVLDPSWSPAAPPDSELALLVRWVEQARADGTITQGVFEISG